MGLLTKKPKNNFYYTPSFGFLLLCTLLSGIFITGRTLLDALELALPSLNALAHSKLIERLDLFAARTFLCFSHSKGDAEMPM